MMTQCKSYLKELLKQIGFKQNQIYDKESDFSQSKATPWVVVLAQPDKLETKKGKAVKWVDDNTGKKYIRHQKYERTMLLEITFGCKDDTSLETFIETLLEELNYGIDDGKGNYISIEPKNIKWLANESILKAQSGAILFIQFIGGIFKDEEVNPVKDITVNGISINKGG